MIYSTPPKKSLGQNFLNNTGTLTKILEAGELNPEDDVVEIGPGHGILTQALSEKVKKITTIELDDRLIPELKQKFSAQKKVAIIHGDALQFNPPETPYKLIANIPYYITSPLLNHFLREQPQAKRPNHIVLLVQYEVAQKICAKPGDLSVLALQVQIFGKPSLIAKIPASHFTPPPQVDSAILKIEMFKNPLVSDEDLIAFFKFIHMGFLHKRKKLGKNLKALPGITTENLRNIFEKIGLNENSRSQELSIPEWKALAENIHTLKKSAPNL